MRWRGYGDVCVFFEPSSGIIGYDVTQGSKTWILCNFTIVNVFGEIGLIIGSKPYAFGLKGIEGGVGRWIEGNEYFLVLGIIAF